MSDLECKDTAPFPLQFYTSQLAFFSAPLRARLYVYAKVYRAFTVFFNVFISKWQQTFKDYLIFIVSFKHSSFFTSAHSGRSLRCFVGVAFCRLLSPAFRWSERPLSRRPADRRVPHLERLSPGHLWRAHHLLLAQFDRGAHQRGVERSTGYLSEKVLHKGTRWPLSAAAASAAPPESFLRGVPLADGHL